jgi:hypothetical protein
MLDLAWMPILEYKAVQIYISIITKVIEDEEKLTVDVQISFLTLRAHSSHKGHMGESRIAAL